MQMNEPLEVFWDVAQPFVEQAVEFRHSRSRFLRRVGLAVHPVQQAQRTAHDALEAREAVDACERARRLRRRRRARRAAEVPLVERLVRDVERWTEVAVLVVDRERAAERGGDVSCGAKR